MSKILIGCDPELFLKNKKGELISAHNVIPGTKAEPYAVEFGAIQVDGAAAEFNIEPAKTMNEFVRNIDAVVSNLRSRVEGEGLELVVNPTAVFEPEYFGRLPESVRELGCNPDFSAYTKKANPAPDGESTTMRTASGHLHIGWTAGVNPFDPNHFEDCCILSRELDYYLGLYSLMWDPDNARRSLYGKAGAFRPKPYGCEYRTLSNVWLRSIHVQQWIYSTIHHAINRLSTSDKTMYERYGDFAKDCIDNNKTDWYKTVEGKGIIMSMDISMPDYKACLDTTPKPLKPVKSKKKIANYTYDPLND